MYPPQHHEKPHRAAFTMAIPETVPRWGAGGHESKDIYQMLVVEKVHHSGRPVSHGDEIRRRSVQTQQAQGGALLHTVHGISERQTPASLKKAAGSPRGPS